MRIRVYFYPNLVYVATKKRFFSKTIYRPDMSANEAPEAKSESPIEKKASQQTFHLWISWLFLLPYAHTSPLLAAAE